jgi:hypothetical protein
MFLREAVVNSIQNAASRVARNIANAQDLGEPNGILEVGIFFDGG